MARILWLSDLHYMRDGTLNGHDTRLRLDAAVNLIAREFGDADAVLVTGDLTENGHEADYRALAAVLDRLPMPALCANGNHDERSAMALALPPPGDAMPLYRQFTRAFGEDLLVVLDTVTDVSSPGRLCPERFEWLRAVLTAHAGRRILLAMHHAPVALGLPNQDQDRLVESEEVLGLLADHGGVAQILCGHVHRQVVTAARGIPVISARGVAYQTPPVRPAWNWDGFRPAAEPATFGVIDMDPDAVRIHMVEFCGPELVG